MKTLTHSTRHDDNYFHVHPLHATFSLILSLLLALLAVLMLVSSAR